MEWKDEKEKKIKNKLVKIEKKKKKLIVYLILKFNILPT